MGVGKTIDRNSGDMLPADNTVTHVPVSHLNGTPSTVSSVSGTASTMDTVQSTQLLSRYPPSQPTVIEKGVLKFVITDSPSDLNIENHIKELIKYNVTHVCRASEPSYSALPLIRSGIQVHELLFQDGDPPPENVLQKWLLIVEKCFIKNPSLVIKRKFKLSTSDKEVALESGIPEAAYNLKPNDRISVHCVAGLGRAPVLVAVALVEFGGMDPFEAVAFIRKHRRGAINKKQLKWLEQYEPRYATTGCSVGCSLM